MLLSFLLSLSYAEGARKGLVNVAGHYSFLITDPQILNEFFSQHPDIEGVRSIGFDAFIEVSEIPFGLGARYENLVTQEKNLSFESRISWTRIAILLNKRIMEGPIYFGPIVSFAIINDFQFAVTDSHGVESLFRTDEDLSVSAGFEMGINILIFNMGVEVGYLYSPNGDLINVATKNLIVNSVNQPIDADLSGPYLRAAVGLSF